MSNADRQRRYRDKKRNAPVTETEPNRNAQAGDSVTRVTPELDRNAPDPRLDKLYREGAAAVGLEIPLDRIGAEVYYHPRTHPERLNWGEPMTRAELEAAGLKANRVPIPGDWDYAGAVDDTVTPAVLGVV